MPLKQFPGDDEEDEEPTFIGRRRGLGQIQRDEHMSSPQRATLTGNRGIRQSSNRLGDHEISWIIAAKIQGDINNVLLDFWIEMVVRITEDLNNGQACVIDGNIIAIPTRMDVSEGITPQEVDDKLSAMIQTYINAK